MLVVVFVHMLRLIQTNVAFINEHKRWWWVKENDSDVIETLA